VSSDIRKARDVALLDRLDACARETFDGEVWRVVRGGRDPLLGHASVGRWSDGRFDVLYTSLERETALAEIFALLTAQPVFPSKSSFFAHRLRVRATRILRLPDDASLAHLGIDVAGYRERRYAKTQEVGDAAHFLDFQAIVAPSARLAGANLILFTEKFEPQALSLIESDEAPIDWQAYRATHRSSP
jgi:RES domain-containing protein